MKTKFLILPLVTFCMVACSTSEIDKKIKEYQKEGMTIVQVTPPVIYVSDGRVLFAKNVETRKKDILIDLKKKHYTKRIYPYFENGQTALCTKSWVNDYMDFERDLSDYQLEIFEGFGLFAKGTFNNEIYQFEDELFFLFNDVGTCYQFSDCKLDTISNIPCISFKTSSSLWRYGDDSQDPRPKFPQGSINDDVYKYWCMHDFELPMEIFDYTMCLYMSADGQIIGGDDIYFEKVNKRYTINDMFNGTIFVDFDSIMTQEVKKHSLVEGSINGLDRGKILQLIKKIPYQKFSVENKEYFSEECFSLFHEAWSIPSDRLEELGSKELLYCLLSGHNGGHNTFTINEVFVDNNEARVYFTCKNSETTKEEGHRLDLKLIDGHWVIDDFANYSIKKYIKNQRAYFKSQEWEDYLRVNTDVDYYTNILVENAKKDVKVYFESYPNGREE